MAHSCDWQGAAQYFTDGFALSDLHEYFAKALLYQVSLRPAWSLMKVVSV